MPWLGGRDVGVVLATVVEGVAGIGGELTVGSWPAL
jgi:hypothetical protein